LAFFFVTPPALLFAAVAAFFGITEDPEWLGVVWNGPAWFLGFWDGLPVLLASGIDGLIGVGKLTFGEGEPHHVKRARVGLGAAGLAGIIVCLAPLAARLLPDNREGRAADELLAIATTIVDASMGGEPDVRFVGGYSEYDLRGSSGVLRDAVGSAPPTLVYASFEILVSSQVHATIEVGVDAEASLVYLGGRQGTDIHVPNGMLERASEPLSGLADYIQQNMTLLNCLSTSAPPDLPGLVDRQPTIRPLCTGSVSSGGNDRLRIRDLANGSGESVGGTGVYRVWVRAGGAIHRLEGQLYSHEGRLWIGRSVLDPSDQPPIP